MWTESCAWLLIQKSTNSLLNNDNSRSPPTVCSREESNYKEYGLASLAGWLVDPKMSELRNVPDDSTRK